MAAEHIRPTSGDWALTAFGIVLALLGLPILAGGAWLVYLGGSFYYLLAGLGLLVSGVLLMMRQPEGAWLYAAIFVATVIWAVWEVGLRGWALAPRVIGPAVLAVILLLFIPVLRRRAALRERRIFGPATAFALVAVAALVAFGARQVFPGDPVKDQLAAGSAAATPGAQQLLAAQAQQAPAQPGQQPGQAQQPEQPGQQQPAQPGQQPGQPQPPGQAQPGQGQPAQGQPGQPQPPAPPRQPVQAPLDRNTAENWLHYGANNHATRFTPADQITPDNVSQLEVAWHIHTGDLPPEDEPTMPPERGGVRYAFENTPLKVGDNLYVCTPSQQVIALDPATGEEKWRFDPELTRQAMENVTTSTCRGVAYYEVPSPVEECQTRIIYGTLDSRLLAIDAQSGQPCRSFGNNGTVDLNAGIGDTLPGYVSMTSPPTIVRGVAVVGHQVIDGQYRDAPSGVVRGFDAVNGAFRWAWDMGRPGVTTQPPPGETYTRGTPNVWTITSADEELGLVYLPTGNAAGDYYGGDRRPYEEQFNSSIVAVDVTTGQVRWSFQTVHHDIWDYDLGSQGTLVDFPTNQGPVPALILPTKQGPIFVFDRRTGEPLLPIEERPVPQGAVEGDWTSPTQPYSPAMPNIIGPPLIEAEAWGISPIDQLWCRIQFHRFRFEGTYTPPTTQGTIFNPGFNGGVDWGGVAVDTERNILVVNSNRLPNVVRLLPRPVVEELGIRAIGEPPSRTTGGFYAQRGLPYGAYSGPWRTEEMKVPCIAPPWGYLTGIDLETQDLLWQIPLGTGRDHGPFGVPSLLPIRMGTPNNGGSVVTRSGLIFIAATLDRVIRAFNTETGEQLWEARLPAGGQAGPISYVHEGRQYVVQAAGGHNSMETKIGDSVIAYALPVQ